MSKFIPLSEPYLDKFDINSVAKVIKNNWVSSAGKEINEFEGLVSAYTKSKYTVACINGTSALHISLKIAGVKKNDEVIVPTLTFIAPINAIAYNNANPIFMDSDKYYNIDTDKTISFIKKNTKLIKGFSYNKKTNKRISAIIIVHVWGNAANIQPLISLCRKKNIKVIEDATESLGTFYKDFNKKRHTGTIGDLGCLSFNGNKVITTGGGGMIITNNYKFAKKAKYFINQAKDDSILFRHDNIGYNYRLTNLQAALGISQIKKLKKILLKKKEINKIYKTYLSDTLQVKIFQNPSYSHNNYWINVIQFKKNLNLKRIVNHFEKNNIQVRPIWKLNHTQKIFKSCQKYKIQNADVLVKNSLCIPSSYNLKKKDIFKIIKCIKEFFE